MSKKYWIKLNAHFFKDSHMIYLKTQKNGYEYLFLWQSLLLKSLEVDEEQEIGFLRLNDKTPYSPELFAEIFNMNIDTIKTAIDLFVNLGMMEILSDGTIYIESVQKLIGKESESAERVRLHRERKNQKLLQCNSDVTNCNPILIKKKKEDKEEDKEEKNKNKMPTIEEISIYCKENDYKDIDPEYFWNYYNARGWKYKTGQSMKDWKSAIVTWRKNNKNISKEKKSYEHPMAKLD